MGLVTLCAQAVWSWWWERACGQWQLTCHVSKSSTQRDPSLQQCTRTITTSQIQWKRTDEICHNTVAAIILMVTNKNLTLICTTPIIHILCPPKFCITIVVNFFWVLWLPQEKLKTMIILSFWGGNKVYYGKCANGE